MAKELHNPLLIRGRSHPLFFKRVVDSTPILLDTRNTLGYRLDLMDGLDHYDIILWLLPYKGEGFDGATFATSIPEKKSRFVVARRDLPKQRDMPREERAGAELPVEHGLLENTDCLAVRFSHGARTSVGVVCACAANADLSLQTYQASANTTSPSPRYNLHPRWVRSQGRTPRVVDSGGNEGCVRDQTVLPLSQKGCSTTYIGNLSVAEEQSCQDLAMPSRGGVGDPSLGSSKT